MYLVGVSTCTWWVCLHVPGGCVYMYLVGVSRLVGGHLLLDVSVDLNMSGCKTFHTCLKALLCGSILVDCAQYEEAERVSRHTLMHIHRPCITNGLVMTFI